MRRLGTAPRLSDFANQLAVLNDWFKTITERNNVYYEPGDPTATSLPKGQWVVYKNTTTGEIRIWVNDDGVVKKSAAFT